MVYDEGFNVELNNFSFFAFSKYSIETSGNGIKIFKSKCYSTLVGWYSNRDKTQRGCYKAMKMGVDPLTDTFVTAKKENLNIVNSNSLSSFLESSESINSSAE